MNQGALNARKNRKTFRPDRGILEKIINRLHLSRIERSIAMFIGNCPICGGYRTFILWADRGEFRCGKCGIDGRFGPAPERGEKCRSLSE